MKGAIRLLSHTHSWVFTSLRKEIGLREVYALRTVPYSRDCNVVPRILSLTQKIAM